MLEEPLAISAKPQKVGAYGTGKLADRVRVYNEEADTMEVVSMCGLREN